MPKLRVVNWNMQEGRGVRPRCHRGNQPGIGHPSRFTQSILLLIPSFLLQP